MIKIIILIFSCVFISGKVCAYDILSAANNYVAAFTIKDSINSIEFFNLREGSKSKTWEISSELIELKLRDQRMVLLTSTGYLLLQGDAGFNNIQRKIEIFDIKNKRKITFQQDDFIPNLFGAYIYFYENSNSETINILICSWEEGSSKCHGWEIAPVDLFKENLNLKSFKLNSSLKFMRLALSDNSELMCEDKCWISKNGTTLPVDFPLNYEFEWGNTKFGGTPLELPNSKGILIPIISSPELGYNNPRWCIFSLQGKLVRCLQNQSMRGGIIGNSFYCYTVGEHLNTTRPYCYLINDDQILENLENTPRTPSFSLIAGGWTENNTAKIVIYNQNRLTGESITLADINKSYHLENKKTMIGNDVDSFISTIRKNEELHVDQIYLQRGNYRIPISIIRGKQPSRKGIVLYVHGGPAAAAEGLGSNSIPWSRVEVDLLKNGYDLAYGTYWSSHPYSGLVGDKHIQDIKDYLGKYPNEDVIAIGNYLKLKQDVYLIGHSHGGYIAALTATRNGYESPFSKIIGYATPYNVQRYAIPGVFTPLDNINPMAYYESLSIPYLALHGKNDLNCPLADAINWLSKISNSKNAHLLQTFIYDGDHSLDSNDVEDVSDAIIQFLNK